MRYRTSSMAEGVFYTFWFDKNLQGDVVSVYNETGTKVLSYTYDAWGNKTTTVHNSSGSNSYAQYNAITYRGYYFDSETNLYYVSSRYYDAKIGRFVSPDNTAVLTAAMDGLTDKNYFAYCDNNPIMRADKGGDFWHILVGAAVGVISQYVSDVVENVVSGQRGWDAFKPKSSVVDYVASAASGALAATGIGALGSKLANSAISGAAYAANQLIAGEEVNTAEMAQAMISSAITSGAGINGKKLRAVYKRSNQVLATAVSSKKIAMYTAKKAMVRETVKKEIVSSVRSSAVSGFRSGLKSLLCG